MVRFTERITPTATVMEGVNVEYTHVYPVNDLIEHDVDSGEDCECRCNPKFEYDFENNNCIIVHDAMDRREVYE